jgi:hypothetical protein
MDCLYKDVKLIAKQQLGKGFINGFYRSPYNLFLCYSANILLIFQQTGEFGSFI